MIEVEELTKYYGNHCALRGVSFSIDDRAIVGFLGLNGAGKSTLLEILSGLLLPSGGRVAIDGVDAVDAPDSLRSRIGFLPEDPPLYDDMRVGDFLTWCGEVKGRTKDEVEDRLPDVAEICDIDHKLGSLIGTLSQGYRKRVGIAQAIIHDPELVILDEPISGLDPVQIVDMRDVLSRLREERTVLVSSHILAEISETCDRVLVLHEGELVADGTEEELVQRLGGGIRLAFELRGDAEAIASVLSDFETVEEFSGEPTVDDLHDYEVQMREDEREGLVAALVEAGVGIRGIEESQSELEQAFLGATGEAEQSAGADDTAETEKQEGTSADEADPPADAPKGANGTPSDDESKSGDGDGSATPSGAGGTPEKTGDGSEEETDTDEEETS